MVPGDMHRNGRPVDPAFRDSEVLYRRFPADLLRPGMQIPIYAVPLPDVSVNRSKHGGRMEYVLYDVVNEKYLDKQGVVQFTTGAVPQPSRAKSSHRIEVRLSHEPLELNYFHAEIQAHDTERGHLEAVEEGDEAWIADWRIQMRTILRVVRQPA